MPRASYPRVKETQAGIGSRLLWAAVARARFVENTTSSYWLLAIVPKFPKLFCVDVFNGNEDTSPLRASVAGTLAALPRKVQEPALNELVRLAISFDTAGRIRRRKVRQRTLQ